MKCMQPGDLVVKLDLFLIFKEIDDSNVGFVIASSYFKKPAPGLCLVMFMNNYYTLVQEEMLQRVILSR